MALEWSEGSARVDSADRAVNVELKDAVQRAKRDAGQQSGAVRSADELMASKRVNGFGAVHAINAFKMRGNLDGCLRVLSYLDRARIMTMAWRREGPSLEGGLPGPGGNEPASALCPRGLSHLKVVCSQGYLRHSPWSLSTKRWRAPTKAKRE